MSFPCSLVPLALGGSGVLCAAQPARMENVTGSSVLLEAIPTASRADVAPSAAEGSRPLPKQASRERERVLGPRTGLTGRGGTASN